MTLTSAGFLTAEEQHAAAKKIAIREMEEREKAKQPAPPPKPPEKPKKEK